MSEPLGVEERARLRAEAENLKPGEFYPGAAVLALLDEVDRLTEALEAAERHKDVLFERGEKWKTRTERAEALFRDADVRLRALLDTATEEGL